MFKLVLDVLILIPLKEHNSPPIIINIALNSDKFSHKQFTVGYQVRNARDGFLYTDRFNIIVVELNHTELATAEDKASGIDTWVRLFKAKTWEEMIMIAQANTELESAAESIYVSNSDYLIRKRCREREDHIRFEEGRERRLKEQEEKISELNAENSVLTDENSALTDEISALTDENSRLRQLLESNGIEIPS